MAISVTQYAKALYELTEDAQPKEVDERLKLFVHYLYTMRQLKKANQIIAAYETYAKQQAGSEDIVITSAHPLDEKILSEVKKVLGTTGQIVAKEDNTFIGGVVIKKGHTIFDASLKTALANLHQTLIHST